MGDNITPLLRDWYQAKAEENFQQLRRRKIEAELCKVLDVPAEGSKTIQHGGYKVTVTQPVTRTLDEDEWTRVRGNISEEMWPVKMKIEADPAGCKYLANNEPEAWKWISSAFETKPGKTGFKIVQVPDGD